MTDESKTTLSVTAICVVLLIAFIGVAKMACNLGHGDAEELVDKLVKAMPTPAVVPPPRLIPTCVPRFKWTERTKCFENYKVDGDISQEVWNFINEKENLYPSGFRGLGKSMCDPPHLFSELEVDVPCVKYWEGIPLNAKTKKWKVTMSWVALEKTPRFVTRTGMAIVDAVDEYDALDWGSNRFASAVFGPSDFLGYVSKVAVIANADDTDEWIVEVDYTIKDRGKRVRKRELIKVHAVNKYDAIHSATMEVETDNMGQWTEVVEIHSSPTDPRLFDGKTYKDEEK